MSDTLPPIWEIDAHTIVKHAILRRYLEAWLPILSQQTTNIGQRSREILFIDGFAGPGRYKGGEDGSPVIALNVALNHAKPFPTPIRMLFIEIDDERYQHLKNNTADLRDAAAHSSNFRDVEVLPGECDAVLQQRMSEFASQKVEFGPALAFLDQFGYGAVSMELIKRILSFPSCEVFSYLGYKAMNRWISDPAKAETFARAFGGDEWRQCIGLNEKERRDTLLQLYKRALKERAGAKYVVSFLMFDRNDLPLYWLLFCTNNLRGLEEMKRAMWAADDTGGFRFSDRDNPDQLSLLEDRFDDKWLAGELADRLNGKTMSALEVKEYVLTDTPCHKFKFALKALESEGIAKVIKAPSERRTGKFNDEYLGDIQIRFSKGLF